MQSATEERRPDDLELDPEAWNPWNLPRPSKPPTTTQPPSSAQDGREDKPEAEPRAALSRATHRGTPGLALRLGVVR